MDVMQPHSPHRPTYAALIARERLRIGITQRELAGRVGVSVPQVEAWERGRYEPRARHLRALARNLGIGVDMLLDALERSR